MKPALTKRGVGEPDEYGNKPALYFPDDPTPAMSNWIAGTGSELENGATGFIAWRTRSGGYGIAFSYRRDGGWGSQEGLSTDGDEPEWADDGDPDFAAKEVNIFGSYAITHFMPFPLPLPPETK
jgi:hypothetical protein